MLRPTRLAFVLALIGCGNRYLDCPRQLATGRALEKLETACAVSMTVDNPYDPAQLAISGELEAPDGTVSLMPGFFGRDFSRALAGGVEQLTPVGEASWRVRFSAAAPGRHRWRWRLEAPGISETSGWQDVMIEPAAAGHGFLRRSPSDARRLAWDDGAPFTAIGENVAWADGRGTFAYDDWLAKLHARRASFVRVWMANWGFGLEWPQLGRYDERLDRAWALDQVLETAQANGLTVMLSLQEHGAFSTSFNSNWAQNPYSKANGGPLATPQQFFVHPEAKRLFKQRLRYVVARWGWAPHLMAWELWNEVDLTLQTDPQVQRTWHQEMAAYLKGLDPHRHLVSTSLSGLVGGVLGLDEPLFGLDEIDFAQLHLYGGAGADVDFTLAVPEGVRSLARFGKPVLAAEVGVDFRSAEDTLRRDPRASGFHDALWTGVLSGSVGTGMAWWWDTLVDPHDLYPQLEPVATFTDAVPEGPPLEPATASAAAPGKTLRALALFSPTTCLAWVKNIDDLYFRAGDSGPIDGATLTIEGALDGAWSAHFVDPWGGPAMAQVAATASSGRLTLALPRFSRDVAVRLERAQ